MEERDPEPSGDVVVDGYALDDVVRCLSDLESRRVVGKAVLVP